MTKRIPLSVVEQLSGVRLPIRQGTKNHGGRPRGELRSAIATAAQWFYEQRTLQPLMSVTGVPLAGATQLELLHRAQVGQPLGRGTIKNMVQGGELVAAGRIHVDGQPRPLTLYAPAPTVSTGEVRAPGSDLAAAMGSWLAMEQAIG